MSNLTEFLLARIAEDEAVARSASPGPWATQTMAENIVYGDPEVGVFVCDTGTGVEQVLDDAAHIAHFHPARILAECEAKRRIVAEFGSSCSDYFPSGNPLRVEREAGAAEMGWEFQPHWPERYAPFCDGCAAAQSADIDHGRVLRLLALPYADHPDYREAWRP